MPNIHRLINQLSQQEAALREQSFLAPLTGDGLARLRIAGLIYTLRVQVPKPGWWRCEIINQQHAVAKEQAEEWQRAEYLALWPALRLVLLEQHAHGDWLAVPFNPSDAFQRFKMRGPVTIRLVEAGQPFERVIGRVEGATIWYDEPDRRADPATAEQLRDRFAQEQPEPSIAGLGAGERIAFQLLSWRKIAQNQAIAEAATEQRLRAALTIGGATLLGYQPTEDGWRVTWERDGQRGITEVDNTLNVVSAGICLSGEDEEFDLASVVGVITAAPDYARYDDNV